MFFTLSKYKNFFLNIEKSPKPYNIKVNQASISFVSNITTLACNI